EAEQTMKIRPVNGSCACSNVPANPSGVVQGSPTFCAQACWPDQNTAAMPSAAAIKTERAVPVVRRAEWTARSASMRDIGLSPSPAFSNPLRSRIWRLHDGATHSIRARMRMPVHVAELQQVAVAPGYGGRSRTSGGHPVGLSHLAARSILNGYQF